MKTMYSLILLCLLIMLILILRFFSIESSQSNNSIESTLIDVSYIVEHEDEEITINNTPTVISNSDEDELEHLLELINFQAIDMNNVQFYSIVTSRIDYAQQTITHPFLEENYIYDGSLFRYPEHANYSVTKLTNEYDEEGVISNNFTSKTDYSINNDVVYFSDEYGQLNYFPFEKEDAFLETVGQLERITKFFQANKSFVTVYPSQDKVYVSLALPDETFMQNIFLLTETVFNGYFDTKTKEEALREQGQREQLNWPALLYAHTITLVLTTDYKLESYYVNFESDAYSFDQSYRYYYTLMTTFFNINNVSSPNVEQ